MRTRLTRDFILHILTEIHRFGFGLVFGLHLHVDIVFVDVLLVVLRHGRVLHEGVVAIGSGAMEVAIDFVTGTLGKTTIDVSVVELETIKDLDVVVEVLAVHYEHVLFVGDVETTVLVAVEVGRAQIWTQAIRALGVFFEDVETLKTVILQLQPMKLSIVKGWGFGGAYVGTVGAGTLVA